MIPLTPRQQEIYDYCRQVQQTTRLPPTIREIQDHFGMRSANAVIGHLRAMEHKGWMTRRPGRARGHLVVLPEQEKNPLVCYQNGQFEISLEGTMYLLDSHQATSLWRQLGEYLSD